MTDIVEQDSNCCQEHDAEIKRLRADREKWKEDWLKLTEELDDVRRDGLELERLRAALRGALSMVESFASGPGFSVAGRNEYENYRRALKPKP